jgi:hypothetical protein
MGSAAALAVVAVAPIANAAATAAAAAKGSRRDMIPSTSFMANGQGRRPPISFDGALGVSTHR